MPRAHHSIASVDRLSNEVSTTCGTVEIQDLNLQQWQRLVTALAVSIPSTLSLKQRDRGLGGGGSSQHETRRSSNVLRVTRRQRKRPTISDSSV
jgi:hypothetical protein